MSDALPDQVDCLSCKCALRPTLEGGRYHHSGKKGATCTCTQCEGHLHTEFAHRRNLSARERKAALAQDQDRTAVEPGTSGVDSSSVPGSPAPASPSATDQPIPGGSGEPVADTPAEGNETAPPPAPVLVKVEDPPGTKRISNSEIQTFKRCKRKWWLGYYRRLEKIQPQYDGPRPHGTKMHLVLEQYYSPGPLCLNQTAAMLTLNHLYKEDVDKISASVTYENESQVRETVANLQKELELSVIMLEGFFEWIAETGADADLEIVGAEETVEYPLTGFDVPVILMGKIDVRARRTRDGAILAVDHKNVGSIADKTKLLPMDEQPLTYMLLERLLAPEGQHVTGSLISMLRKVKRTATAKPPFYARVEVPHNQTELRNFWARLHGEIRDIVKLQQELDAGADPLMVAYPTPDRSCSWGCDYFEFCSMLDDGSRVEDYIAHNYHETNPYARYDTTEDE